MVHDAVLGKLGPGQLGLVRFPNSFFTGRRTYQKCQLGLGAFPKSRINVLQYSRMPRHSTTICLSYNHGYPESWMALVENAHSSLLPAYSSISCTRKSHDASKLRFQQWCLQQFILRACAMDGLRAMKSNIVFQGPPNTTNTHVLFCAQ